MAFDRFLHRCYAPQESQKNLEKFGKHPWNMEIGLCHRCNSICDMLELYVVCNLNTLQI